MSIAQSLLPEFDHEMATTRKMLAAVPEGKNDWRPHPRSMTLGRLAGHVAELPGWGAVTMEGTELDFAPADGPPIKPAAFTTREADADFMVPWTLKAGASTIFTMPRVAVVKSFTLNHMIHHRAQLGVYLRLNDIAIPGCYGPSADEPRGM
jgi:uncharacterized damage-inducible protein DinB